MSFQSKYGLVALRSDPKYGKFIAHKPSRARIKFKRIKGKNGDTIKIELQDFISPSIIERLQSQTGLTAPKITDWRAMIDSVMIDTAFNGKVFSISHSDIPERKQNLINGTYEVSVPSGKTTVAAKVTDMLGEEVLITAKV